MAATSWKQPSRYNDNPPFEPVPDPLNFQKVSGRPSLVYTYNNSMITTSKNAFNQ